MPNAAYLRSCVAELIATFILIAGGCGAAVIHGLTGQVTAVEVSVVFGLAVTVMIYTTGHISHAHMNPAVSIALAATGHFPLREVPGYIVAQVVGAALAAAALGAAFRPEALPAAMTLPTGGTGHAFWVEVLATGILMFVIMGTATDGRAVGPAASVAIGAAVVVLDVVAGPISGGSLNPARSLGPAIAVGNFTAIWLYVLAPLVGALAGAFGYQLIRGQEATSASPTTTAEVTSFSPLLSDPAELTTAVAANVFALRGSSPRPPGRHADTAAEEQASQVDRNAVPAARSVSTNPGSATNDTDVALKIAHWEGYWDGHRAATTGSIPRITEPIANGHWPI